MMTPLRRSRLVAAPLSLILLATSVPPPVRAAEAISSYTATATTREGVTEPANAQAAVADSAAAADSVLSAQPKGPPPSPSVPPGDLAISLVGARELIKNGDYDGAIDILKAAIDRSRSRLDALREAYLLLIMTHVMAGNSVKELPQGRVNSELRYEKARKVIGECLSIKDLRHTRPEPPSEYPEQMINLFADVRGEMFGSFRVAELVPRDAVVLLDADTLRAFPGDSLPGDVDLAVGPHLVVVRAQGRKHITDQIAISPNSTLERPYQLSRRRGRAWYATVTTGAVGLVGGAVALLTGRRGTSQPPADEPLPGAPPPPTR